MLHTLPYQIAFRLQQRSSVIAEHFDLVTVLFADLVGFTQASAGMSPEMLVELLNSIFSRFDIFVDRYGVEKIKTVGDEYMVAGGLPNPEPDHVLRMARLAIAMQEAISTFTIPDGKPLTLRIGMNTGPMVAGVIGTKKLAYDLWGNTVNVASRMETAGLPGRIQVTEATYKRLRSHFVLEPRGEIEVKGKGPMMTYWLFHER
ncbi:MAG: adenylate/guanylate cyclase domain-containing protein [Leptolyngbyaceae cyanobacterium T60_A2020_046]|nr:adenylate/guanylate cyclase domain-containing protein [Leptolyngbyaceae cyanobacterium T60_A2020_046]